MDSTIGITLSLFGIFLAVFLFIVTNHQRLLRKIEKDVAHINEGLDKVREGPVLVSSNLFWTALANEAKFWGKLFIQRQDKVIIANRIASKYIEADETIVVDSGTTVDQIPSILRATKSGIKVYTNNLLAAISVLPPVAGFDCFVLPGRIDPLYGATYNLPDPGAPLQYLRPNKIILSAVAISFEDGPMVEDGDLLNLEFKRALVQKTLHSVDRMRLIIAVDWTKFAKTSSLQPALDNATWKAVRQTRGFALVTTQPPDSSPDPSLTQQAVLAKVQIKLFTTNMKADGMQVEICNPW